MVLINVSDHNLRHSHSIAKRSQNESGGGGGGGGAATDASVAAECVGMLFGVQTGLRVEIFTSYEAVVKKSGDSLVLDKGFVEGQIKLSE